MGIESRRLRKTNTPESGIEKIEHGDAKILKGPKNGPKIDPKLAYGYHQEKIRSLGDLIVETNEELRRTRDELGIPHPAEEPPSVLRMKESKDRLEEEQKNLIALNPELEKQSMPEEQIQKYRQIRSKDGKTVGETIKDMPDVESTENGGKGTKN